MTIVVIGHGRSPEGKRWGSRIDRCETVVRMWDWTWQPWGDYGSAYHYGLFVLTPKGLRIFNQYVKSYPSRGWLAYFGKPTSGVLPAPVEILDNERWNKIAIEMGGSGLSDKFSLTRGCAAAAWAIETASKGCKRVILVGFDNVQAGLNKPIEESFSPEYWALYMSRFKPDVDKVYPIGTAKTATHDMAIEFPFLQRLASEHNVKLELAQEVW